MLSSWKRYWRTMEKGAGKVLGLGVPWRLIRSFGKDGRTLSVSLIDSEALKVAECP